MDKKERQEVLKVIFSAVCGLHDLMDDPSVMESGEISIRDIDAIALAHSILLDKLHTATFNSGLYDDPEEVVDMYRYCRAICQGKAEDAYGFMNSMLNRSIEKLKQI